MNANCLYIVVVLLVGYSLTERVDFNPEAPCSERGGVCVSSSECPNSSLEKGLCPKQQSRGAECCDRIPESDRRCRSHGGECVANCPPTIRRTDLKCPAGTDCCIWLR